MNIFESVKDCVTAKDVAQFYGLKVRNNGMACCPFHNDKHPSMKVDTNYYCFGCGSKGDAVAYVAELYELSQYDAALKLIADMRLPVEVGKRYESSPSDKRRIEEKKRQQRTEAKFKGWCLSAINSLCKCRDTIKCFEEKYAGQYRESVFDMPEWVVLYKDKPKISYMLDILYAGTEEDKVELFLKGRGEVAAIVERIGNIRTIFMAGSSGSYR